MTIAHQKFAHNLRAERKAAGLTQAELGRRVYAAPRTISNWEHGLYLPPPECQKLLRQVLGDTALLDIDLLEAYEAARKPDVNKF